ncbi:hypothetical protein [Hymenobacter terrenus]|uniref:hypothetical protein n=1 Tax=Hymenobacter terrenus TaxID=1629124 RepID=UPI000619B342|nr:hypothetical protein [Hymenobacter terrenus]
MPAPYHDLYLNHFVNIRCSRAAFLAFLGYTVTATTDSPKAAIKALAPGLSAAAEALGGSVATREGQAGTGQTLTRSRKEVLRAMRVFVQDTNAVNLVPTYRPAPDKIKEVLPQGLMYLTKANSTDFPVRFQAFAEALTAHQADLGPAPGTTAAALLTELTAATTAKDAGLKVTKETIGSIGGQWEQACQLLWQVHCTALATFWEKPSQAEAYFNYGLLPRRNPNRDTSTTTPATTPNQ